MNECKHTNLSGPTQAMMEDGDWRNVCRDCLKAVSMETCCVCKKTVERDLTVMMNCATGPWSSRYLFGPVCDFCLDHNDPRY